MWVFGYGSLMFDSWESQFGCTRRELANLEDYRRAFNKASTSNWGTKSAPGPTLNLVRAAGQRCTGVAFQFEVPGEKQVHDYLAAREGKSFELCELSIRLKSEAVVDALVPIYVGRNTIKVENRDELVDMILSARGKNGSCVSYVENVAKQL